MSILFVKNFAEKQYEISFIKLKERSENGII